MDLKLVMSDLLFFQSTIKFHIDAWERQKEKEQSIKLEFVSSELVTEVSNSDYIRKELRNHTEEKVF